jgi:ketosteroid isomerase-like protein
VSERSFIPRFRSLTLAVLMPDATIRFPRITREAIAERGATTMADNGAEVIALDRKRMDASCQQDFDTLDKLIADDLIYTHSNARQDTKASLIGNMKSGSTVYTAIVPSDVVAQDLGDVVVLTGIAQISTASGGRPNSFGVRFVDVYAKRNGNWQMVTWQSTRLP